MLVLSKPTTGPLLDNFDGHPLVERAVISHCFEDRALPALAEPAGHTIGPMRRSWSTMCAADAGYGLAAAN